MAVLDRPRSDEARCAQCGASATDGPLKRDDRGAIVCVAVGACLRRVADQMAREVSR